MNAATAGSSLTKAFFALLRRDLLLAFRRRTELLFPVIFLLVVISLFPLGIGPSPQLLARIAPGVIWIAALLATVISLDALFRSDFEDGTLEQFIISGHPLTLISLAKIVAHWLVAGLPIVLLSPLLAVWMNLPPESIGRDDPDPGAWHAHPEPDRLDRRGTDDQPETGRPVAVTAGISAVCPHLDHRNRRGNGSLRRPPLHAIPGSAGCRPDNIGDACTIRSGRSIENQPVMNTETISKTKPRKNALVMFIHKMGSPPWFYDFTGKFIPWFWLIFAGLTVWGLYLGLVKGACGLPAG